MRMRVNLPPPLPQKRSNNKVPYSVRCGVRGYKQSKNIMTHAELKPILQAAGFTVASEHSEEGSYTSYERGKFAAVYTEGRVSVWIKSGAVLLPFADDIEEVKRVIEQQ